ncbi:MAG TPA: cytochrome c-type biogenesis protein CcmH [Gemmatimonadaceae bacterium]|nr:cytochrome c-type biogenesis protein CcmH [Gemmatimonadaceae bacterium]
MTSRREFMARAAGAAGALALFALNGEMLRAQDAQTPTRDGAAGADSMPGMNGQAKPVRLPPKAGATPSMTAKERDDLEHRLHCQCGTCVLDVYTCRTTDFTCQVSPAMHRDVLALVEGGHSAQEIIDAFVGTYGQRVLMAPSKSGFNLLAWFAPGIALLAGGAVVALIVRRLGTKPAATPTTPLTAAGATRAELDRLEAAVKGHGEA